MANSVIKNNGGIAFIHFTITNDKSTDRLVIDTSVISGKTVVFIAPHPVIDRYSDNSCLTEFNGATNELTIVKPNASYGGATSNFKVTIGYLNN